MSRRTVTLFVAGLTIVAAAYLVTIRGGVIAWGALLAGAALLLKSLLKPSGADLAIILTIAAVSVVAWIGVRQYVISTWESGEVVELTIDTPSGPHIARLWVLDVDSDPVVYYDAPPEAAESLLAGKPLQFTRAGEVSTRVPNATPADELPEAEANLILEAMNTTYSDQSHAATVYYLMLGSLQDRIPVVVHLTAP